LMERDEMMPPRPHELDGADSQTTTDEQAFTADQHHYILSRTLTI
jgi:hypothetical protein